jgi:hypothetical protein
MSSGKKIEQILHPAHSPEFAPRDLFLFSNVRQKLIEYDILD